MSSEIDLSIIIPSRKEQFLNKTIRDILEKAETNFEIIAVLEGYWPDEIVSDPHVHYIHFPVPRGMRGAINAGVASARGKFVMKLDAHCLVGEGFDEELIAVCQDNWVCVPTRHRLDAENWKIDNGGRPPINYLYMDLSNDGVNFKEWREKNHRGPPEGATLDDILSCQGSCYFLPKAYYHELELLDEKNYGSFRKDPQEVCFKALSSGGRVVRVFTTYYAHLHKGRRYGRGYSTSRPDWAKGDEYIKRWLTDSAWDKQTIPFKEILARFPDMPGRKTQSKESIPEELPPVESPKESPPETHKTDAQLPNLYQYLEIDGIPFSRPKPGRASSRFWNEGKWKTFIEPLLPNDCTNQTLVEMGCDAGLFLKLAQDHGYQHVIGVEKNKTPVREGLRYRDAIGYKYNILKRTLGGAFGEDGSFDIDELPVADITVMSTFHYYIMINAWVKYLDRLASKTCYALIVSRPEMKGHHWIAQASYAAITGYFRGWKEVGLISNVPKQGDPKPRDLYSILLQSPLIRRIPIAEIAVPGDDSMERAKIDLARQIIASDKIDLSSTTYYHEWKKRKRDKWSMRTLRRFVQMKADVMRGVKEHGLMDPLIVQREGLHLSDGGHRLTMLKALGHESVIVREV